MEPQPLAVFGKKSSGGPKKCCDRAWTMVMNDASVKEEGSPSIKLGLGIGAASAGISGSNSSGQTHVNVIIKREKPVLLLTPSQLNELQHQSLIYKYLVAGLPVPLHLVLPIWKSVATTSSGSANGCIYKQYPSFRGFSPRGYDYRTMMEPEPSRCRRTDGKKWRCKRDVLPNYKYCERHINRGRQRSRKHVEAPEIASPIHTTPFLNTNNSEKSNIYQTNSVPTSLQLRTPTSDDTRTSNATTSTISAHSNNERNNTFGLRKGFIATRTITTPIPTVTLASSITATTSNNINSSCNNVHKEANGGTHVKYHSNAKKSSRNVDIDRKVYPLLDFSPKSVIQAQDGNSSWVDERNYMNSELRCRRTDGKKWQCKNDVIPKSKYCTRHMHRGAKRHCGSSQPVAAAAAVQVDDSANMNTNLSIAISASSPSVINDERSTTTSSSETISANDFINDCSSPSHTSALSPP